MIDAFKALKTRRVPYTPGLLIYQNSECNRVLNMQIFERVLSIMRDTTGILANCANNQ